VTDAIESPLHYSFGMMEAREIIELAIADFTDPTTVYHVASALKYLLRASRKNGADDIAKARKHIGWAEDAARAHELRALRNIPPPHYNPADVAFRHGDINRVCGLDRDPHEILEEIAGICDAGEFTQPPNCVHESTKSTNAGHVEKVDSKHPMHAVALEMAESAIPKRRIESAWSVTWPGDAPRESAAAITEYQTLVGN
jgi:hypothetical protein